MPVIKSFGGLLPRFGDYRAPVGAARVAENLWLSDDAIRPWRTPLPLADAPEDAATFHADGCSLRFWDKPVRVADWLPDDPMLFLVGRTHRPEILLDEEYRPLGVPAPDVAPTLNCSESYGETSDARSYVYTWVNDLGHESGPSPPSRSVTVRDGDPVVVSGLPAPPEGWNIAAARVYRSATAWREAGSNDIEPVTGWLEVGQLAGSTLVDQSLLRDLGPALRTIGERPPPAGLSHILRMDGTGALVGAACNMIHFSESYKPWNWPPVMDLTLPNRVVNLGALGTTVFATTEGLPVVVNAEDFCSATPRMTVLEVRAAPPDVARSHARSAAVTPFGLAYSSAEGLVLLQPDGGFSILTAGWYDRPTWAETRPETARLAWWRGRLFCVTDAVALVLEIDSKTFGDSRSGYLTTLSLSPTDMQVTASGNLLMLEGGRVSAFDMGDRHMWWTWETPVTRLSEEASFTVIRVLPSGARVTVRGRGTESWSADIPDGSPVRMTRLGRTTEVVFRLEGDGPVDRLEMAASLSSLMSER